MMPKPIIVILLFIFSGIVVQAQPPMRFKRYSTENGLSQGTVYSMFQDSRGLMWFGTWDGLNRFDGYGFTTYKPSISQPKSITGNFVSSIVEDKKGLLWIGTNEGINCFDYGTNSFSSYHLKETGTPQSGSYKIFYIDDEEKLWISCNNRFIALFDTKTKQFTILNYTRGLLQYSDFTNNNKSYFKKVSFVYSAGNKGVAVFDIKKHKADTIFTTQAFVQHIKKAEIKAAYADTAGKLWLSSYKGLIHLDTKTGNAIIYDKENNGNTVSGLMGISPADDTHFWLGSYGFGVYLFDKQSKKYVQHITKDDMAVYGLSENIVDEIFRDKDGNVWFGTQPSGLSMHNPALQQFDMISMYGSRLVGAQNNSAQGITALGGNKMLFSFYQSGMLIYDIATHQSKTISLLKFDKDITALSCFIDGHKNVWAGTDYGLLYSTDSANNFQIYKTVKRYDFYDMFIFCPVDSNQFLLGNSDGLYSMQYKAGNSKCEQTLLSSDTINWISRLPGGLFIYANASNKLVVCTIEKMQLKKQRPISFPYTVKHIQALSDSVIWISTSKGIIIKNIYRNQQEIIDESNGLSNNYVYACLTDEMGNIWASTNDGINRINIATHDIHHFTVADGLQGKEYNTLSFFKKQDGHLFFGGTNGINFFDPGTIQTPAFAPPLQLMSATINGRMAIADSFLQKSGVTLNHQHNSLSFFFTAIDFNNAGNIIYSYQINNEPWIVMGKERNLRLLNLAPGNYHLQIKAGLQAGIESPNQLAIFFTITPPWYKTWPAIILFIITALALLYIAAKLFIRSKVRKQQLILEKQQAVLKERERIIADLHDDVGGGLSTIRMMSDLMLKQQNITDKPIGFAGKISDTAKDIAQRMHTIIWSLNAENDSLGNFAEYVRQYGVSFFEDSPIAFVFTYNGHDDQLLNGEQRKNLFLIIKEALHNILKHSKATKASIHILANQLTLSITIADNGRGISEQNLFGNGLKNMQNRMREINGSISWQNLNGTHIELSVSPSENKYNKYD